MPAQNVSKPITDSHPWVKDFGTTANRPTIGLIAGQKYFDYTLISWIYWDGAAWQTLSGGGGSANTFTGTNNTGSTIAANKAVASDGTALGIKLADAGATNDFVFIGFTTASIANGASGQVQTTGVLGGFTGLTAQNRYWIDTATPGNITNGVPSLTNGKAAAVGVALSATTLTIQTPPRIKLNATATQTNFLAFIGGVITDTPVAVTPANNLGAVALQATTPGTQQTGNENISGKLITGGDIAASGNVSGVNVTASGILGGLSASITNAISAASAAITGAITAASATLTGTAQAAIVNATSKVQLNGVTVLENGTSFPGSPSTNQRYFRTDLKADFFYDGTRWLSVQNYLLQLIPLPSARTANSLTATTANINYTVHPDNSSDVYVTSIITAAVVNTTNNGSNYWTTTFNFRSVVGGLTSYTGNTSAGTAGTITPVTIAVNAVVTRANFTDVLQDFAKVGAPGTLFFDPAYINCKLVGV